MSWNYRVVRRNEDGVDWYSICEVYYDKTGAIEFWSEHACVAGGSTFDELKQDMQIMMFAFARTVLNAEDLPGYTPGMSG